MARKYKTRKYRRGGKLLSAFSNNPGGTNPADNFSGTELVGPNTSTNATGKNFGY